MELNYCICYPVSKNKINNIKKHYDIYRKINWANKQFHVIFMVDSKDENERNILSKNILKTFQLLREKDVNYQHMYHWGGTIAALYTFYKSLNNNSYIAFFEDDFYPTHPDWLFDAEFYLSNNLYIGEGTDKLDGTFCKIKIKFDRKSKRPNFVKLFQKEAWTDSGFYFSTTNKLKEIENNIGIFHKGDQNNPYDNELDGVDLGEVGFPTQLYNKQLPFTGLFRKKYFVHASV